MLDAMELMLFVLIAVLIAIAAQLVGVDTRDLVRQSERTGSHAPLTT